MRPKNNSIKQNIIFWLTGIITVTLLIFSSIFIIYSARSQEKDLEKQAEHLLSVSMLSLSSAMWQYNKEFLVDYVNSLFLYDNIVFVEAGIENDSVFSKYRDSYEDYDFEKSKASENFITRESNIVLNNLVIGSIKIVMSKESILKHVFYSSLASGSLMLLVTIIISLTMYILFSRYILKPLHKLDITAKQIADGKLNTAIDISKDDEIGHLANTFSKMMNSIKSITASRDELNKEVKERKKTEAALKKSEMLHIEAQSIGKIGHWERDFLSDRPNWSDEVYNIFRLDPKNRPPSVIEHSSIIHPEDLPSFDLVNLDLTMSGKPYDIEVKILRSNGETGWIRAIGNAEKNESGKVIRMHGIAQDITELKIKEEALSQEKELLMVTLRSIGDGVITTNISGEILLINRVAEKLTGWTQEEAKGKNIEMLFNIINGETRKKCENPIEKVLKNKAIVGLASNTILISKSGEERMIADSGAPILDSRSKVIGVVLVFRDITEKHQMDKQLQQAQRIEGIGTLAGGIAHDFNNMLGVITGNISFILSELKPEDRALNEILSDVLTGAEKAKGLTQQLLTFAKGGKPIKEVFDLNPLLKESAKFAIRGSKVKCDFNLSDKLCLVEADKGQINQVINNLVINANQSMPNGGIIKISTENKKVESKENIFLPEGLYVHIKIEDRGEGISEKHIQKIFDPYFSTKEEGSGLGLATTYSIIKNHDGYINVESVLEKGTVFEIYLPVSEKNRINIDSLEKKQTHSGSGKILVMDDDQGILNMVDRMLCKMGYEVLFAKEGEGAVLLYEEALKLEKPFDVVILDLTIPGGMGGQKTMEKLLVIDPHVKAIVSSGYSNDPVMSNYRSYGFCGVVPKPYSSGQMSELLEKVLVDK